MGYITEFQYAETGKRKLLYYNTILSYIITGILFADFYGIADAFFPYQPVSAILAVAAVAGIGSGNGVARLIFKITRISRAVYILTEIIFIAAAAVFFLRGMIFSTESLFGEPVISLFMMQPVLPATVLFGLFFITGMKSAYIYKIGCGEFIDNHNGAVIIPVLMLAGLSIGLLNPVIGLFLDIDPAFYSALPALILPCIFLLNLSYNPVSLYAKVFERESSDEKEIAPKRENVFFTYLNSAFIVIYLFLGYLMITVISGEIFHVKLAAAAALLLFIAIGYFAGMKFKITPLNAYTGAVFPPVFTAAIYAMAVNSSGSNLLWGLTLAPAAVLFGLSLNHQFRSIVSHYDHKKRFSILNIILLTLPVPVLISLNMINFSNGVFIITVYAVAFANLIIPAVNLAGKGVKFSLKGIYLLVILILIPASVVIHIFLKIPVDNAQFVKPVKNYDELKNINYNSPFIRNKISITYGGLPVFNVNDSTIRNLKRAVVPVVLYNDTRPDAKKRVLFIDGNQQFFRNPVIGLIKNQICLDPVSSWAAGGRQLPFSGRQRYIPESDAPLNYISSTKEKFGMIVDIHNLYDQNRNLYKFSGDYHVLIKTRLAQGGIYANMISLQGCREDFLYKSVQSLKKNFKNHTVFLFSDVLVIFSTDDPEKLVLSKEKVKAMADFIQTNDETRELFFSEYHALSGMICASIEELEPYIKAYDTMPDRLASGKNFSFEETVLASFAADNKKFLKFVPSKGNDVYFMNEAAMNSGRYNQTLALLKKFERSESLLKYDTETAALYDLKRLSEYIPELASYLKIILGYKIRYYESAAQVYEKERNRDEAKKLYLAVLKIKPGDFGANYRLGILFLTLQDIDNAYKFLQNAQTIDPENPGVLFQMGILNYSNDKNEEAIKFFKSAIEKKERSSALFKYLALSYEKTGNVAEAEANFQKALLLDPNDAEIIKKVKEYKKEIDKEEKPADTREPRSDLEVEQGVKIDIPVNRSAYDIRLGEKGE